MTRFTPSLAAAIVASFAVAGGAMAQDKAQKPQNADKTQVVPSKEDLKPMRPSVGTLDDNAQRAHDRDRAADTTGSRSGAAAPATRQAQASAGGVRDWGAIDANNDNLISPDEMEAALKEVGPQAKPASTTKQ